MNEKVQYWIDIAEYAENPHASNMTLPNCGKIIPFTRNNKYRRPARASLPLIHANGFFISVHSRSSNELPGYHQKPLWDKSFYRVIL